MWGLVEFIRILVVFFFLCFVYVGGKRNTLFVCVVGEVVCLGFSLFLVEV